MSVIVKTHQFADISSEEFQKGIQQDNVVILDVRTKVEFISEHIPNAVSIDIYDIHFSDKIVTLDKSKKIYVYCRAGHRSALAADYMSKKGFEHLYNLKRGILEWKSKGFNLDGIKP